MAKHIYFHIWNNHFKMWGYDSYYNNDNGQVRVIFYWGSIKDSLGLLQQKEKIMDYWDAHDLIKKKIDEKLHKGYVAVLNADYHKFVCGDINLSQFLGIIEYKKGIQK